MTAYTANLDQIASWFFNLAEQQAFFFPEKTAANSYRFEKLPFEKITTHQIADFFAYKPSILPPGKKIFPDGEILFSYHKDDKGHYQFTQGTQIDSQILAGVRACDLKGIYLLDTVFSEGIKDTHYLQRREQTSLIAFTCLTPCDEHCFCQTAQSLDFQQGADIFITPLFAQTLNDNNEEAVCLIEVLSEKGKHLVKSLSSTECARPKAVKSAMLASRPEPFGRQFNYPPAQIEKTIKHCDAESVYQDYAQRCFSCGTCNLVCPTCYCFDTQDEFALDARLAGGTGKKTRHWDACLNPAFAEVAGGHNFRAESAARQRHRVRRKFTYLPQRFDSVFCTGCGRCGRQCTTGIDIFDIVNDVCTLAENARLKSAPERQE